MARFHYSGRQISSGVKASPISASRELSPDGVFRRVEYENEADLEAAIVRLQDRLFGPGRFYLDVKKKKIGNKGSIQNIPDSLPGSALFTKPAINSPSAENMWSLVVQSRMVKTYSFSSVVQFTTTVVAVGRFPSCSSFNSMRLPSALTA